MVLTKTETTNLYTGKKIAKKAIKQITKNKSCMAKEEFSGELRQLDPKKIIKKNENNKIDNFFLILGLIFNDLKSLTFYSILLNKHFAEKNINVVSINSGEYHGMRNHLNRLITSTIYEFFVFLEKQSRIIKLAEFKTLFEKLSPRDKKLWQQMLNIAQKENLTKKGDDFITLLGDIRNNGSFHYYSSGQNLRNGYINHFYDRHNQHESNNYAYYSKGNCMKDVRYFYCDASIQGFNYSHVQDKLNYDDYSKSLLEIVEKMNISITTLMKRYTSSRK